MTKVAAIQMVSGLNTMKNLSEMKQLVAEAKQDGAELILLPEFFSLIIDLHEQKVMHAEVPWKLNADNSKNVNISPIQKALSESAEDNNVWIVGGSVPLRTENRQKINNSMLAFNNKGVLVSRYDKVHLFKYQQKDQLFDETEFISAGNCKTWMKTPAGNTFFSICYDIRFPEFYRKKENPSDLIDLILVSAAFTYETGKAAVVGLTRQMAIDFGPTGITVNAIAPGHIVTEAGEKSWQTHGNAEGFRLFELQYPVRRTGVPDDIAHAVSFLCSSEASFINGVLLPIDGGLSIQLQENIVMEVADYVHNNPDLRSHFDLDTNNQRK